MGHAMEMVITAETIVTFVSEIRRGNSWNVLPVARTLQRLAIMAFFMLI
jgi:hypothetical protein